MCLVGKVHDGWFHRCDVDGLMELLLLVLVLWLHYQIQQWIVGGWEHYRTVGAYFYKATCVSFSRRGVAIMPTYCRRMHNQWALRIHLP